MKNLTSIEIMRVLVLVAAVLLWLNVYGFQNRQLIITAPVKIVGLSQWVGIIEPITGIEAKVSGNARELATVNQDSLNFIIDLSHADGVGEFEADVKLNQVPEGVDVISFNPTHLTLTLNDRGVKEVPVVVNLKGSVADGYHVEKTTLAQTTAMLSGAGDLLEFLSEASVMVLLNNQSRSFSTVADVVALDSQGRPLYNVDVTPTSIPVSVTVASGVANRTLGISPIFSGELPGGYWIREVIFTPSVVTVEGDDEALKQLAFVSTTPIQLTNKRESFSDQIALDLPSDINAIGSQIVSARVVIERASTTRQINITPEFINVADGYTVSSVEPTSIRVVVSGEESALANLSREDVKLIVNLAGALTGQNVVEIKTDMFTTNSQLSVVSYSPDTLELILSRIE